MNIYEIRIIKLLQTTHWQTIIDYRVLKQTIKGLENLKIAINISIQTKMINKRNIKKQ